MVFFQNCWAWVLANPAVSFLVVTAVFNLAGSALTRAMGPDFLETHPRWATAIKLLNVAGLDPVKTLSAIKALVLAAVGQHPAQVAMRAARRFGPYVVLAFVVSHVSACAGSFEEAKLAGRHNLVASPASAPSAQCVHYDSAHRTWGGIAAGAAFAAGASGLAIVPLDDKTSRALLISGGVALGTASAISTWVASDFASAWARSCSQ